MDVASDLEVGRLAAQVGRTVVARRAALGLTRAALANRCGLSRTILGRVERGETNPSLETLWKVARALDLPLSALLDAPDRPAVRRLPARAGTPLEDPSGMTAWLVHADPRERRTELFELLLPAGAVRESPGHLAGTEEVVLCLSGALACGPAGAEEPLGPGDAVWLAADVPHVYRATGEARALNWLLYPPATA